MLEVLYHTGDLRTSAEAEKHSQDSEGIRKLQEFAGSKGRGHQGVSWSLWEAVTPLSSSQPSGVGGSGVTGPTQEAPDARGREAGWKTHEAFPSHPLTLGANFPCWHSPDCRECQSRDGSFGKQTKERKENILERR